MSYFPHLENEHDNVESPGLRFMLKINGEGPSRADMLYLHEVAHLLNSVL